jgi:hypothetical protein
MLNTDIEVVSAMNTDSLAKRRPGQILRMFELSHVQVFQTDSHAFYRIQKLSDGDLSRVLRLKNAQD